MHINGDGNFKVERRDNRAGEHLKESWIGDAGFWAPQKKIEKYLIASEAIPSVEAKVRRETRIA